MAENKEAPSLSSRFGAPKEFRFTVPPFYKHEEQIDNFHRMIAGKETVFCFDDRMSGEHFPEASHRIVAGRRYVVCLYPVLRMVSTAQCLDFLEDEQALLVGLHGLTLLYQMESRHVARGRHVVSFDVAEKLWKDEHNKTRVPVMNNDNQIFLFDLSFFHATWTPSFDLLCFKEA